MVAEEIMTKAKRWGMATAVAAGVLIAIGSWLGRTSAPPDKPTAAAPMSDAARAERFARSPDVQAGIAVGEFTSFYFVNTRARPNFCASMKVDISPFVLAFSEANAAEWTKAQALMRRANIDPEAVWRQSKQTLDSIVLRGLGDGKGIRPADTCLTMNATPDVAAAALTYSKINPVLHGALMAAK
jgi:hypothetical protein